MQIAPNVFFVGAVDWDRRMFDELIPLPDGTSYNSYLIRGTGKTALLDTVDPTKAEMLFDHLESFGVDRIDYVISHHAEQDHSGTIPEVLKKFPMAKVVTNEKCKGLLIELLCLKDEDFIVIADGEELSLGDKTLKFVLTPWVHWPETMVTYLKEDRVLFTCDFLGSHMATASIFVDEYGAAYESAKRYFAEIMMPFRLPIRKNLEKIKALDFKIIAPSHGFVYDKPQFILDAYADWTSDNVKNEVLVPYNSMHGATRKMVDVFVDALRERNIAVKQFNLAGTDLGKIAIALVDGATIVLGTSQVLAGAHPNVAHAAFVVNALRPKTKFVSLIGSYLWGGQMVEQIKGLLPNLKAELLEPVVIKGYPKENDFKALAAMADTIAAKHKAAGIL
ncbi:MAG: MBL fold hydrolase [Planctomycetes bacterium GWF2_50_10]|nr:MAG: MBL fold hydrolase [Planctomycetes bacterium GWF2_50_10]